MMLRAIIKFVVLAILVTLPLAGCGDKTAASSAVRAPDFTLPDTSGKMVSLSDFRGKPVFINFWESNCAYCVAEMPLIQQLYDKYGSRGVVVLTVNIGGDRTQVEDFLAGKGYTIPTLIDGQGSTASDYQVSAVPKTVFIDKDGIIRDIRIGAYQNLSQIESSMSKIYP